MSVPQGGAVSDHAIEHRQSRTGRWLRERRIKFALWIAVAEGILVAILPNVSRWTVIIVAVPLILLYLWSGRSVRSDTIRQLSWIAAASQSLAVVVAILAFVIKIFALLIAGAFAAIAIVFLFLDRR
jgi:hypothetical protein